MQGQENMSWTDTAQTKWHFYISPVHARSPCINLMKSAWFTSVHHDKVLQFSNAEIYAEILKTDRLVDHLSGHFDLIL